ncbi:MAG: hypothetical protein JXB14_00995 [Candidatus Altiarchaeota archaeon]|nr:hypothetical protein [Candidatus Altiarchaeota archaeon]
MKRIIIWTLCILILTVGANAALSGQIKDVVIRDEGGNQIYPTGMRPITAGEKLYFDLTLENTGDVQISKEKVKFYVQDDDTIFYCSDPYLTPFTDDWLLTVAGSPASSERYTNILPSGLLVGPTSSWNVICPEGPNRLYIEFYDTSSGDYLLHQISIPITVVRTDQYDCLYMSRITHRPSHWINVASPPADPYMEVYVKNCGNRVYDQDLYVTGKTGSVDITLNLHWDTMATGPQSITVSIPGGTTAMKQLHFDNSVFLPSCTPAFANIYSRLSSSTITAAPWPQAMNWFNTHGCTYPLAMDSTKTKIGSEKAVYVGETEGEYYYRLVMASSLTPDLVPPAYAKVVITLSNNGIPPTVVYTETDIIPIEQTLKQGEEMTLTGTFAIPKGMGLDTLINFVIEGWVYKDDDNIPEDGGETLVVGSNDKYIADRSLLDIVCYVPVKEPGSEFYGRTCDVEKTHVFFDTMYRLFFYEDIENINCPDPFNTRLVVDSVTGTRGLEIRRGTSASACQVKLYYTPAVTSMSPDPIPVVLLLLIAASLAMLVQARLRRMRLEREGKHKKASGSKNKAKTLRGKAKRK